MAYLISIVIAAGALAAIGRNDNIANIHNIFFKSKLEEIVAASLKGTKGNYAVVIKNFKTGDYYSLNKDKVFQPASLYKLWVMAAVFEKIKTRELQETDVLESSIKELNEEFKIASEEAELKEGEIKSTVGQALEQMITISHNYSALLLSSKVKNSSVMSFIRNHGFFQSGLGDPPRTTAEDIASFYEKLYKGEIVDAEYSKKMLDLLSRQKLNDRIPKYLPKETKVAHKTGELFFFKHDAGIVFSEKGDYVLVALSETNSPKGAAERIAKLSEAIYKYFQTR